MPPSSSPPETPRPQRLLRLALRTARRDLLVATVLYSTHQIGESLVPVIVGSAIGHAVDGGDSGDLLLWLGLLAADFLFLSFSYRFGARAATRARQITAQRVRMWLVERVVAPTGDIRMSPGDLLARASSDAARVGGFAGQLAYTIATSVVLVTSTVLLLRASVLLGAVIVLGTAAQIIAQRQVWALLRQRSMSQQEHHADAASLAEDLVRGLRVLRGIGAQRIASRRYAEASDRAATAAQRATSSEAILGSIATLFAGCYLALVAGVGGWLALRGHLGLGQLVAALGLARFVIGPMETVSAAAGAYARALASATRVQQALLAAAQETPSAAPGAAPASPSASPEPAPASAAGIRLRLIGVSGNAGGQDGDGGGDGVTLAAAPGDLVGLVCPDAARAAGLLPVLTAERAALTGLVEIDGLDIATLAPEVVRRAVLVAPHDAVLLPGSIADNVSLRAAGTASVSAAMEAAFVDEVLEAVPEGADTDVGDRGEALSGGQRQRVALARALAADPPALVLHDPTTAVDAVTEDEIAARVRRLRAARTTLVLTSSPAWLARCDRVLFWHRDLHEIGTHAELLTRSPAYRELVTR